MRERKEHCKVINLRSGKDVHIHVGVPKRKVEPVSIQEDSLVEEESQQPTFQPTNENNQATKAAENNKPAMVKKIL